MPSLLSRQAELARLIERPFAHRGLHGGPRVENSRAAFEAAIAAGDGIELDVQSSADGEAMVFHDSRLERLTERDGRIGALSAAALSEIRLRGSSETIPTLREILQLIDARVALLIEVKSSGRGTAPLNQAVERALSAYRGPVAVMSFDPAVGRWFASRSERRLRGLVVSEAGKPKRGRIRRRLATCWAKPDLLAYDVRDLPSAFAEARRRRGLKVLTWTCRTDDHRAVAADCADQIIYEQPA